MGEITRLTKTDCINFDKENRYCKGLMQTFCNDSKWCPFYKSEEFYEKDGSKKGEVRHELGRQGA